MARADFELTLDPSRIKPVFLALRRSLALEIRALKTVEAADGTHWCDASELMALAERLETDPDEAPRSVIGDMLKRYGSKPSGLINADAVTDQTGRRRID